MGFHIHTFHMYDTCIEHTWWPFCFPKLIYLTVSLTISLLSKADVIHPNLDVYSSWEKLECCSRETVQCPCLCCGYLIEKVTWKARVGLGGRQSMWCPCFPLGDILYPHLGSRLSGTDTAFPFRECLGLYSGAHLWTPWAEFFPS